MSEQSREAVVAGEAAAAAVEEVQSREALTDSVASIAETAVTAEVRAETAEETAEVAVQTASEAITAATGVADRVDEAQYVANAATSLASDAVTEAQEAKDIARTTDEKLDMILAALSRHEEQQKTTSEVQEVPVHDSAQTAGSEQSTGSEESDSVQSRPPRRQLGRIARRNARRGSSE